MSHRLLVWCLAIRVVALGLTELILLRFSEIRLLLFLVHLSLHLGFPLPVVLLKIPWVLLLGILWLLSALLLSSINWRCILAFRVHLVDLSVWVVLKGWESHACIGPSLQESLVVHLELLDLRLELFDLQLLHAHFFLGLTARDLLFLSHVFALVVPLENFDVLLESMVLLSLLVDLLQ